MPRPRPPLSTKRIWSPGCTVMQSLPPRSSVYSLRNARHFSMGFARGWTTRDAIAVRRAAHTLKGAAATAAAGGLAEAAALLEVLAAEGDLNALDSAWLRLSEEAAALLKMRTRFNREMTEAQ